jgi:hypothetical protein
MINFRTGVRSFFNFDDNIAMVAQFLGPQDEMKTRHCSAESAPTSFAHHHPLFDELPLGARGILGIDFRCTDALAPAIKNYLNASLQATQRNDEVNEAIMKQIAAFAHVDLDSGN